MIKKEIFKNELIKLWKIIKITLLIIITLVVAYCLLTSILAAIFMIIRMNNGYLSPWMLKVIKIEEQALKMWANS